ncbi:YqzH family protein [Neobacillus sp. SM06]|uniref:YqzH family protein n=1 Tax=Neobacillus sp. SM06 TaxID=3422492 RepID=UPI003D277FC2
MDKRLIEKMIQNCLKQYDSDRETLPVGLREMDKLYSQIYAVKAAEPEADLYEIVNDVVYEFLTAGEN